MLIGRGQQLLMADADGATRISDLANLEAALKELDNPGRSDNLHSKHSNKVLSFFQLDSIGAWRSCISNFSEWHCDDKNNHKSYELCALEFKLCMMLQ